jgi:hypothetical protein
MMAATVIATLVAFYVDGYSAGLPAYAENGVPAGPAVDSRTEGQC